ncbi:coiled-coil domain-containing protein [Sinomicrobium sp.]
MQDRREKYETEALKEIKQKLERFIRKYYANTLIKGVLLFTAIGLLYFLFTLFVEHLFWFGKGGRTLLFWLFVFVEVYLLYRFIGIPLMKMFRWQKGIGYKEAATIIGAHFPEVGDKLINVLQLSESSAQYSERDRELLLAGIEQKSVQMQAFSFHFAVDFKRNLKYVKYALIPFAIVFIVWISGNISWFSDSYKRVVDYRTAYEPPAPFKFFVMNDALNGIANKAFEVRVKVVGEILPEDVEVHFNGQRYFMQKEGVDSYKYVFEQPQKDISFYLSSGKVSSKAYLLRVDAAPLMTGFEMQLHYPSYIKRSSDTLRGTGNATVPEGTEVLWVLNTENTTGVSWSSSDTLIQFEKEHSKGDKAVFSMSKHLYANISYNITTANEKLKDYESLGFDIRVIKDEYPEIDVKEVHDSTALEATAFVGQISDDYGFYKLTVNYYPEGEEEKEIKKELKIASGATVFRFAQAFPGDLKLGQGLNYLVYFEVRDNDVLRGGKSAKSSLFSYRMQTKEEIEREASAQQKEAIKNMERTLGHMKDREEEGKEIRTLNMEKEEKSFNDQQRIDNYLKEQLEQEKMMRRFTRELEDRLEQAPESNDPLEKKLLQERLERQQEELERDRALMEELREVSEKIDRKDMARRLEQLARTEQSGKRNLEQLLELTKRYYVTQNADRLQRELERMAEEQKSLAEDSNEEEVLKKQRDLNEEFKSWREEMRKLEEDNEGLKKPMELGSNSEQEEDVEKQQQDAIEGIEQSDRENAEKKQRNAAEQMKKMAEKMSSSMLQGQASSDMEDAKALRQILKNLVTFSFRQEDLMRLVNRLQSEAPDLSGSIHQQHNLKEMFTHVDDSLFALSLRRPELSEVLNKELADAHFYIEASLDQLAENEVYRAVASQQYSFTAANNLAALLSEVLDNLQENMSMGSGSGSGEMQLPDIIQSQEQLNEQMKQQIDGDKNKSGEEGKEKGDGESGEGDVMEEGEGDAEALYEIYKQQQLLREALEKQLEEMGDSPGSKDGQQLLREMENVENTLLREGMNETSMKQMLNLKHELLKLKEAAMEQGTENRRESSTATNAYKREAVKTLPEVEEYLQGVEILNRQVLPLRQIYKDKVKKYFSRDD